MGNPTSFTELMELEAIGVKAGKDCDTYASLVPAFNPGLGTAFGGHVFAQAVWAASHSVDEGMIVHVGISRAIVLFWSINSMAIPPFP